jgi:hypothetical protein
LTFELANVSNTPVLLYPGRPICQLVLMRIAPDEVANSTSIGETVNSGTAKPDTSYFGPVRPEAPKFKDPQEDLLGIGVTRTVGLKRIQFEHKKGRWKKTYVGF